MTPPTTIDHYKRLSEEYAERLVAQNVLINEMGAILRQARKLLSSARKAENTPGAVEVDERFLEDLREALAPFEAKERTDGDVG